MLTKDAQFVRKYFTCCCLDTLMFA